jgi:hypothetical protein
VRDNLTLRPTDLLGAEVLESLIGSLPSQTGT